MERSLVAINRVIVFCSDPLEPRQPDQAFAREAVAAEQVGLVFELIDFEALALEHDCARAVRRVRPREQPMEAVYRGWMLKPEMYRELHDSLAAKNLRLVNSPAAYRHCHYLPESYAIIEGHTPRSVWMKLAGDPSIETVMELLRPFGSAAVIVKDYVKSRKHEWEEACFISSAADRDAVERVVRKFVELQEEDLNEGLVFREFVEFEPLAIHSKSGMPLTREFRLFFFDGRPILSAEYWDEGDYGSIAPPIDRFTKIAAHVESRFFSMDIAKQRHEDDWMIVELGDGQVAGLPDSADAAEFYRALA
jgi:hypothetical protein